LSEDDAIVTEAGLAEFFDVTDRTVRGLAERGVIERAGAGVYRLKAATRAYVGHLRERAAGRENSVTQQRERLVRAQAERLERENEIARGDVIPRSEAVAAWTQYIQFCRSKLLALPTRLAPLVAERPLADVRETLTDAVHEALSELTETEIEIVNDDAEDHPDG
jgi:phage terminase Nu1 subunit (DNA packaging protein)